MAGAFFAVDAPVMISNRIATTRPASCAMMMLEVLPVEMPLNIQPNETAGFANALVTVNDDATKNQLATPIQTRFDCLLFTKVPMMKIKPAVATTSPKKIGVFTWLPAERGWMVFSQRARPAAVPKNAPTN